MVASSRKCSTVASSTTAGISDEPALLKCSTSMQPGVSRRARLTSIGIGHPLDMWRVDESIVPAKGQGHARPDKHTDAPAYCRGGTQRSFVVLKRQRNR